MQQSTIHSTFLVFTLSALVTACATVDTSTKKADDTADFELLEPVKLSQKEIVDAEKTVRADGIKITASGTWYKYIKYSQSRGSYVWAVCPAHHPTRVAVNWDASSSQVYDTRWDAKPHKGRDGVLLQASRPNDIPYDIWINFKCA